MHSLRHLNKYFIKYKWRLILGILFSILSTFFGIYVAVLVRQATNFMAHTVSIHNSFQEIKDSLYWQGIEPHQTAASELFKYGLLIIGTTLISGFFMFLMRQAIIVMSRHIEFDLKNEIFSHYQTLDTAFYRKNNTGDLMNRISEDVSRVRMYIGPAVMYFASTLATLIIVSATMTHVSAKLSLYVLLPLPILVVIIYFVSDRINKMSNRVQEQLSKLSTIAQETFSGIRVLKAYMQENSIGNYFTTGSEVYRKRYLGLIITEALFTPFIFLLIGLSTILTIYIGGKQAIQGNITFGNIAEFIIYVGKLTWPVASLGWVTSLVQRAAASQNRINEFLMTAPSLKGVIGNNVIEQEIKTPFMAESICIEFRNVSFIYPDSGIKALDNISFILTTGQSLAIIGRTGSGKSSVANLICRLYDVTEGEILIDGKNIKNMDVSFLRKQIGYVPQDTFLFSDSIENNILFGYKVPLDPQKGYKADNVSFAHHFGQIERAATEAGIYKEIMSFPKQFQTMIGERGITLSGGQKQRIAIARAIINSPRILIFDDCFSAVDTETEAEILRNLRRKGFIGNKEISHYPAHITIFISHRVSTVRDASHIIVLEHGKIKEEGSHQQLMDRKGFYYDLEKMQLAEEKETEIKN